MAATALVFPGQGSQWVGMGKALFDRFPAAAAVFQQADAVLGFPLSRLCFEGPEDALNDTVNTQPAVFTVGVAALRAMESRLDGVAFVAGHSLGEFTALVAAGALAFEDALLLVRERGRLMKEAGEGNPGGMVALIGLEAARVDALCAEVRQAGHGYVGVANDNCPGQVVISGDEAALEAAAEAARAAGARKTVRLPVSIAAHSPLMAPAAEAFRQALAAVPVQLPRIPVVFNATARPLGDPEQIRSALARQLTSPVRWTESVRWMVERGVDRFVEVGPGAVLTGLIRRIDRSVERLTTADVLRLTA